MKTLVFALAFAAAFAAPAFAQSGRNNNRGRGSGDPLIEAFDGTPFWFHGVPGHFYNLVSEQNVFQVSTLLKEANNAHHIGSKSNGTYMQGIAFRQGEAKVMMETFADDSAKIKVMWNDEKLELDNGEDVTRSLTLKDGGEVSLVWSVFQEEHGTTVKITTDAVSLTVFVVPPGYDEDNMWQPSYLNLNVTLNKTPKGDLQGVIGDTYNFFSKDAAVKDNDPLVKVPTDAEPIYPVFPDFAYEIPAYFSSPRYTISHQIMHGIISARRAAKPTAGRTAMADRRRRLIEDGTTNPIGFTAGARCFAAIE